ncbi:RNAPII transcription regulator C-terminal-domain-containing protein [Tricharina praecox]|uniref:RNAPII transcription regulator C-terminal-domain-containing protein n=1 Tax=Tricharina praecox TaxID=43433 RepID=UPI00221E43FE|nr:RNAPII transcription regulator C-terminal-domain-containing protein [Tricharina praecox]KAI5846119.1 RNAPII transcription regulator C-terminal-domain-containing protein [Tricharina praecox]
MKEAVLFMHHVDKDPQEAKRIAQDTAKRIESREFKLLEVVQSLGEYLTDDDTTVRAKAIGYLAAVLGELSPKSLSRQHLPVITQFLCDRLEDETGLKEVASGLASLTKMHHFDSDQATKVATALITVDLPKHPPTTRFMVLTLVDALMSGYRDSLKAMGDKFVTGLADMIGGEKDPRNLMIVFSVMKVVLVEFDIVRHTELMFDVVYCYFPITFRPPPDDPYKITANDLKVRLRECIASTHYFAGQVFPALIEKLDSTSLNVKLDVLQTMTACALSYGPTTISAQSSQLWDAVKFEILNSAADDEMANAALDVLKAVASSLSTGLTISPPPTVPLARYLKSIIKECLELLKEPQQKQAKPAGQILAAVATASAPAHAFVIQSTLPALLLIYSDAGAIAKQRALMQCLNRFFDSSVAIYGAWTDAIPSPAIENPLDLHKEKLFQIYSQALMGSNKDEKSFRQTAMRGLGKLCNIRQFLEDSEIGMVVQYLDEIALDQTEKEDIRDEALQNLRTISKFKSALIMQITFPAFMARLPDSEEESREDNKPYVGTLEALAKLSFERPVFEVLLTRLLNKLEIVLHSGSGPEYPRAILSTLLYVLQQKPQSALEDTNVYYNRLIPPLLTKTLVSLVAGGNGDSAVLADDGVLDITGRLVRIITRDLDTQQQTMIVNNILELFVNHNPSDIITEKADIVANNFRPMLKDADKQVAGSMVIFASVLAAVPRDIPLPVESLVGLLRQTVELAQAPKSAAHRLALLRIIGLLVNKWVKDPADSAQVKEITENLLSSITSTSSPLSEEIRGETLRIVFWLAKALLLRADKFGMDVTLSLVDILAHPTFGAIAARGFAVLLSEDELLNKENHAVVRMLYKQRTFATCVPKLVDGFKYADSSIKPNILLALSSILRSVPSPIITPSLPSLLPLLLQSIELPDASIKLATIDTLQITISESADVLQEHVSSVITRLLTAGGPPAVRIKSLRCLKSFPGAMRNELLLPYRRKVLRELVKFLDDKKRDVRKEAVDCRVKWWALGEAED